MEMFLLENLCVRVGLSGLKFAESWSRIRIISIRIRNIELNYRKGHLNCR